MFGYVLSSVAGLLMQMLASRAFGTSSDYDAFYVANRLPEFLFTLISGGALASAFLPTFTRIITQNSREQAWSLASSIINLVIIVMGVLSALAAIFAPTVVRLLAPGFIDPEQFRLTVSLMRVLLISPVVFGVSGLLMATLNAHQHFAFPALAPAAYRVGQILGVLLAPQFGIFGLAWGSVLGAGLHLLIQAPKFWRLKPSLRWGLGLGSPAVREVGQLMAPRLLGVAVVQINFIVNTIIASGQPEGSLAALNIAFTLMIMPQAAIAQSIAVASLPTFAAQVARQELDGLREAVGNSLRAVFFLSLPASVGLILLRRPIIEMLLQGAVFDARSTDLVAWALLWYVAGLVGHSLLEVVVRAFYAQYDTRTPVTIGVLAMTLNIVLSLVLAQAFAQAGLPPHGGLALANTLATALETTILLVLLSRRLRGIDMVRLRHGLLAALLAAAVMAGAIQLWMMRTGDQPAWLRGGVGVVIGLGLYWGAAWLLGAPEARQLPNFMLERWVRRTRSRPQEVDELGRPKT